MKRWELEVSFTTPAFLGDAFQNGAWRTPPFKALLRQWWRVVYAARHGFSFSADQLRRAEGMLFGESAGNAGRASQVRLRMDWREGVAPKGLWQQYRFASLQHPETGRIRPQTDLYLFYGVTNAAGKGGVRFERFSFIAGGVKRKLWLAAPSSVTDALNDALLLASWFGTLGGRSRNGSGSLHLAGRDAPRVDWDAALNPNAKGERDVLRSFARDWRQALDWDWIHAIGKDEQGLLLWRTKQAYPRWEQALDALARAKIEYRTQFHFRGGGRRPHIQLCERQLIAYPITHHALRDWGNAQRQANQILMKVHRTSQGYVGIMAHFAHGLAENLKERLQPQNQQALRRMEAPVWRKVHEVLDQQMVRLA